LAPSRRRTSSASCPIWVEQGEEVIITRHGKEVARLVPVRPSHSREQARAAIRRIRERAEQRKLGPFDWSEWKSIGTKVARESCSRQSATLAWIYSDKTTDPIRRLFDAVADDVRLCPRSGGWRSLKA
jgi:prevent-host-death family protein